MARTARTPHPTYISKRQTAGACTIHVPSEPSSQAAGRAREVQPIPSTNPSKGDINGTASLIVTMEVR